MPCTTGYAGYGYQTASGYYYRPPADAPLLSNQALEASSAAITAASLAVGMAAAIPAAALNLGA